MSLRTRPSSYSLTAQSAQRRSFPTRSTSDDLFPCWHPRTAVCTSPPEFNHTFTKIITTLMSLDPGGDLFLQFCNSDINFCDCGTVSILEHLFYVGFQLRQEIILSAVNFIDGFDNRTLKVCFLEGSGMAFNFRSLFMNTGKTAPYDNFFPM